MSRYEIADDGSIRMVTEGTPHTSVRHTERRPPHKRASPGFCWFCFLFIALWLGQESMAILAQIIESNLTEAEILAHGRQIVDVYPPIVYLTSFFTALIYNGCQDRAYRYTYWNILRSAAVGAGILLVLCVILYLLLFPTSALILKLVLILGSLYIIFLT